VRRVSVELDRDLLPRPDGVDQDSIDQDVDVGHRDP
jgi:hypothetical protein